MRRRNVEPWVVLQVGPIGIELVHGVQPGGVIKHHIHDDRHAASVDRVNQFAEIALRTIRFVDSEIVIG